MRKGLSDRVAGAIILALAIWYYWVATGFRQSFGDPVGPSAFPQMVAVPTGLFAIFLIVRPDPGPTWIHGTAGAFRQVAALLALVLFPILIGPLGFPAAAFIGVVVLARILGATWLAGTVTGIVVGIGLYVIFDPLLGLPLPLGPDT